MTAPLWTLADARAECNGHLMPTDSIANIHDIKIDSRECGDGDLFVALAGEAQDGHQFLSQAKSNQAAAALVSKPDSDLALPQIVVDDSLAGLTRLASAGRRRFTGKMIGITGSVGKTGSKDMLAQALSGFGVTHASKRSFNNHIGVPISLATLPPTAEFAVQEMGMNAAGEIASLSKLTQPFVALITRISATHSAFFESTAEIASAKAEIFFGLQAGGIAVLNHDDEFFPMLAAAARQAGASRVISFGRHDEAEFALLRSSQTENGTHILAEIRGQELGFKLKMHGAHWAQNALGVLACIDALGLSVEAAAASLANCQTPKGRGRRHQGIYHGKKILLIDDSYNASPASMAAAFASLDNTSPTIMVLSEMLELGNATADAHNAVIDAVNRLAPRLVIGLGSAMHDALNKINPAITTHAAASTDDAMNAFDHGVKPDDVIFIKGSLGSGSWRVCERILAALRELSPHHDGGDSHAA